MQELWMKAPAKINLGLDVLRKRPDGYHELRMIMQTVRLHDRIYIKHTVTPGIRIKANLGFLPEDENNLCWKAADLLMQEFSLEGGIFIELKKHIPVAAGLAGGSTDAAAVLTGMNTIFELGLSDAQLMERGVKIGADVPYCIMKGTALAEGIGEILTPLPAPPDAVVLLAKPPVHISTKYVYTHLDVGKIRCHPDIDGQIEALRAGDLRALADRMGNVLEQVSIPDYPVVAEIRDEMLRGGALGAMMSGSGPTVFGIFEQEKDAQAVYQSLWGKGLAKQIYLTSFLNEAF